MEFIEELEKWFADMSDEELLEKWAKSTNGMDDRYTSSDYLLFGECDDNGHENEKHIG